MGKIMGVLCKFFIGGAIQYTVTDLTGYWWMGLIACVVIGWFNDR